MSTIRQKLLGVLRSFFSGEMITCQRKYIWGGLRSEKSMRLDELPLV
jgi:hypothetical protein